MSQIQTPEQAVNAAAAFVGGKKRLAEKLGVSPAAVGQWASGARPVPANRAVEIEHLTDGKVKKSSLCPGFPWDRARPAA